MKDEVIVNIEVGVLKASPWNRPEAAKENGELKELTDSVRQGGILIPLIVRQGNEVVAGHRRLAAAKAAGLAKVPCVVREMTDAEAMETQITENLHRKDLTPLEEARAFFQLQTKSGLDIKTLALTIEKSERYVYRSLALLKLPVAALKALEKGLLNVGHAHQLLRVGPKQVESALKFAVTPGYAGRIPTSAELREFIDSHVSKDLARAVFPKDVEYATKIACSGCPYNSGNQGMLFDGAGEGHCTNAQCFNAKTTEFFRQMAEEGRRKFDGLKFVGAGREGWGNAPAVIKGWTEVDPKDPAVAKAMSTKGKDKFAFGIVKPGAYGDRKKPAFVLLSKDKTLVDERPRSAHLDPVEKWHWTYIDDFTRAACVEEQAAFQKVAAALNKKRDAVRKEAAKLWNKNKKTIAAEYEKKAAGKKVAA